MKCRKLLLLAALLLLGGCAVANKAPANRDWDFTSPNAALRAIGQHTEQKGIYQNTAKVTVTSPDRKMIFRLAIMTQAPDRLRIESIPIFGPPDFFFATQNGQFQIYQSAGEAFITGAASAGNLARVLPLSLVWTAARWVAVLQGRPDLRNNEHHITGEMEVPFYRIDISDEHETLERLWMNRENGQLEKVAYINPGGPESIIEYSQFKEMEGKNLPECIDIDAGNGTKVRIVYETTEIKRDGEEALFTLRPPSDAVIQTLPD